MAGKTNVSVKTTCVKISDGLSKDAALKAVRAAVEDAVKANGKFAVSTNTKEGIYLDVKIVSLVTDDKDAPKKLTLNVSIDGTFLGGALSSFKASGNGSIDGINPKKIDGDVAALIDAVIGDLMKNKVLPQMIKMIP